MLDGIKLSFLSKADKENWDREDREWKYFQPLPYPPTTLLQYIY